MPYTYIILYLVWVINTTSFALVGLYFGQNYYTTPSTIFILCRLNVWLGYHKKYYPALPRGSRYPRQRGWRGRLCHRKWSPLPCQRYQEKRCTSSKYSEVIIFTPRPPQGGEKEEDYIHPAKFSEVRWLVAPSRGAGGWAGLLNCLGKA